MRLEETDDAATGAHREHQQRADAVLDHPLRLARVDVRGAQDHLCRHVVLEDAAGEGVVLEVVADALEERRAVDDGLDVGALGVEVRQLHRVGPHRRRDVVEHPRQTVEAVGRGDLQQGVDQPARSARLLHRHRVGHRPLAHLPHLRCGSANPGPGRPMKKPWP